MHLELNCTLLQFAPELSSLELGLMQVKVFKEDHYLANFVQSTFDALPSEKVKGPTLCIVSQCGVLMLKASQCHFSSLLHWASI